MLELFFLIFIVGVIAIGLLKLLFWAVVLPFKIGFFMLKGLIGLLIVVPVTLIALGVLSFVLPTVLAVIVVPVVVVVGGITWLLSSLS